MFVLIYPWLLFILAITSVILLLRKQWKKFVFLAAVIIVSNWWFECIPFRIWTSSGGINEKSIRIISFNIDGSNGDALEKALNVRDYLRQYPHDIAFIAEFNEQFPQSLDSLLKQEYSFTTYPDSLFFQYFFGHTPFFNSHRLKNEIGEWVGVYACSTIIRGDTLDLYGCHWASNNYNELNEREEIEFFSGFKNIKNIHAASFTRKKEAEAIVKEMSKSSHLAIVLGDMNDVGGSPAIKTLEAAGLKDAWWEKGVGCGATIHHPLPYRIDHIVFDPRIELKAIKVLDSKGVSDHDALYAAFEF